MKAILLTMVAVLLTVTALYATNVAQWTKLMDSNGFPSPLAILDAGQSSALYDSENNCVYSASADQSEGIKAIWKYDLNTNTYTTYSINNYPSDDCTAITLDKPNNRIILAGVHDQTLWAVSTTGGLLTQISPGINGWQMFGKSAFQNPITNNPVIMNGYGYYAMRNVVLEFDSSSSTWLTRFPNRSDQPWKRNNTNISINADKTKVYMFGGPAKQSGQQSGNQDPGYTAWADDISKWNWQRDLWELDLTTWQWTCLLGPNDPSILTEGAICYIEDIDKFVLIGAYKPPQVFGNQFQYIGGTYLFDPDSDSGFEPLTEVGETPPVLANYTTPWWIMNSGSAVYDQINERIVFFRADGIWELDIVNDNIPADITVTPQVIEITVEQGSTTNSSLTIFNNGNATLNWSSEFESQNLDEGLLAWYPLNGNAQDASGNERHGTATGPTPTIDRFGNANSALHFAQNCIVLPEINFNLYPEFSISLWVNYEGIFEEYFISYGCDDRGLVGICGAPGYGVFSVTDPSGNRLDCEYPPINTWALFTMTYNNGVLKGYVNGVLQVSGSATVNQFTSGNAGIVTHWWWRNAFISSSRFTGSVDDVRIYQRELSSEDVSNLYQQQVGRQSYIIMSPTSGSLEHNQSVIANITFDASSLAIGLHTETLNIHSNDSDMPTIPVTIHLNVVPEITLPDFAANVPTPYGSVIINSSIDLNIGAPTNTSNPVFVALPNLTNLTSPTIFSFSGSGTGNLSITVPNGLWFGLIYYSGSWHWGVPNSLIGPGTFTFNGVNYGSRGEVIVLLSSEDPTLPVELSSFAATLTAFNSVNLSWVSESETSLLGYRVYRSDSSDYSAATLITPIMIAATNTSTQQSYNHIDNEVETNNTYYYWLESVDFDDTDLFGPIFVTVEGTSTPPVTSATVLGNAYPNPFNAKTTIDVEVKSGETASVTIYNLAGQSVLTYNLAEGTHSLNWDGRDSKKNLCGSGIYFYRLSSPSMNQTKRMVIVK